MSSIRPIVPIGFVCPDSDGAQQIVSRGDNRGIAIRYGSTMASARDGVDLRPAVAQHLASIPG
jgi:hypothetical protein